MAIQDFGGAKLTNTSGTTVPTGAILLWSGAIVDIPTGYVICNGQNGTPDLRDRFIVGAGSTYAVNATGGATSQNFTPAGTNAAESAHTHGVGSIAVAAHTVVSTKQGTSSGNVVTTATHSVSGTSAAGSSHTHTFTGTQAAITTTPPYYALAYIMKT